MRTLTERPASVIDPAGPAARVGSFRGGLPAEVDLSPLGAGALFRLTHEKRWMYVAIAAGDLFLGLAIVQLGYAANAFAFAWERGSLGLLADASSLGPGLWARVGDRPADGMEARYEVPLLGPSLAATWGRGEQSIRVDVRAKDLRIDARMATAGMPPAIGAIARLEGGPLLVNATEKGALLAVTGEAVVAGRRYALDGGLGGYDYTSGYLARRTRWRWAFALGRAESGERVALNLVEGFVGEAECALWIDGELYPLAEGRFTFDAARPLAEWAVRTADGGVDLRFTPGGLHAETKDLVVVRSRFVQPVGSFAGTIRVEGRAPLALAGVLGVVEDQEVLW